MNNSNEIIKAEIDSIIEDILTMYEDSGKKTSGQFGDGLEAVYSNNGNTVQLFGYGYLAGRKAGKMPPVKAIETWVINKGLAASANASGLAWAIAKKIAKEGTNKENHLPIYEQVLTPQRIDEIIEKVSQFNVTYFVDEITAEFKKLTNNI